MLYITSQKQIFISSLGHKVSLIRKGSKILIAVATFLLFQSFSYNFVLAMKGLEDKEESKTPAVRKNDDGSEFQKLQQLDQVHRQLHPGLPYANHTLTGEVLEAVRHMHTQLHQRSDGTSATMTQFHDQLHAEEQKLLDNRSSSYH